MPLLGLDAAGKATRKFVHNSADCSRGALIRWLEFVLALGPASQGLLHRALMNEANDLHGAVRI